MWEYLKFEGEKRPYLREVLSYLLLSWVWYQSCWEPAWILPNASVKAACHSIDAIITFHPCHNWSERGKAWTKLPTLWNDHQCVCERVLIAVLLSHFQRRWRDSRQHGGRWLNSETLWSQLLWLIHPGSPTHIAIKLHYTRSCDHTHVNSCICNNAYIEIRINIT